MVKRSSEFYEFVDITLLKELEKKLRDREEKEQSKIFKVCKKCQVRKPILQFSIDKRNTLKNGRTGICKTCRIIEYLKYYYENREVILIKNKRYRSTHKGYRNIYYKNYQEEHKEHLQKLAKAWYQKNKAAIQKRNLEYYQANKEACLVKRGLWIENNKEKIREYNRRYKRTQRLKNKGGLK